MIRVFTSITESSNTKGYGTEKKTIRQALCPVAGHQGEGRETAQHGALVAEGQSISIFRDRESRAAVLYRRRPVSALSGRTGQHRQDARRGLCPPEAGYFLQAGISP